MLEGQRDEVDVGCSGAGERHVRLGRRVDEAGLFERGEELDA